MKNLFAQDYGLPSEEGHSHLSKYIELRKQLDKTKKRLKTLVKVSEAQNALLRGLVKKIDPGTEIDEQSLDEIRPVVVEEQEALTQEDLLDEELPPIDIVTDVLHTQKTYV